MIQLKEGEKIGNWEVLNELPRKITPSGQSHRAFLCRCVCGNEKEIRLLHLSRNRIKSCGCLTVRYKRVTDSDIYIRKVWRSIQYRTQKNYPEKHLYFEKGVIVCKEWLNNYDSFRSWAINNLLQKGLHIDRRDSNGNYDPVNCRVVTPLVNANNRSNTYYVEYDNELIPFTDLLRSKGLMNNYGAVSRRIERGWSVCRAVNTPIRKGNYK
jgi:hypothetical protein